MNPPTNSLIEFRKHLLSWFRQFQRDLPWRKTKEPYRIWLSEIMLQQTRVAAVIPYYDKFVNRFPQVRDLAQAPEEEVLQMWSGLGYYSRARNLQAAARKVVAEYDGVFPDKREKVLALPGIGEYTASAILSIANGQNHAVLDGNVARVLARIGAIQGDLREGGRWQELQKEADRLLAPESPGDWNQAMMELGATICMPRSPQCLFCPVAAYCEGRKQGIAERLPEKRKKRQVVDVNLVALVFCDRSRKTLLLPPPERRKAKHDDVATLVSQMWHFPTAPLQKSEEATIRHLISSLSLPFKLSGIRPISLKRVQHAVTYRKVSVSGFLIQVPRLPAIKNVKSLPFEEVETLPISNLTRKLLKAALIALDDRNST